MNQENWELVNISDKLHFANGKSIKAKASGKYVIHGSNGTIGYADDFKFEKAIIIGRVGAYCGSVEFDMNKFWASDNTIVATVKEGDIKFFFYLLEDFPLNKLAGGSAQPLLTQTILKNVELRIPKNINEQRKISTILYDFDSKIKTNLKKIETIDKIMKIIYHEWFINFNCNCDKKICDTWEKQILREVIDYYIGGGWGKELEEEIYDKSGFVIRGTDFPHIEKGEFNSVPLRFHKSSNFEKRKVLDSDIIFEVSGGSKDQPVGRSLLLDKLLIDKFDDNVMFASFCKLIRLKNKFI